MHDHVAFHPFCTSIDVMSKAIRIHQHGGPDVLRYEEVAVGAPGPGQIRVRHGAVGLNFIDVYHRTGLYPLELPATLGMEAAGVVEAVGDDVTDLREGDRVAYATQPLGAYADARLMAANRVVKLPDGIDDRTAAAMMLQGMTAEYLIRRTYKVKAGEHILFHAVAGGVGLIACQWLKHLGATVIGTVGSAEKAKLAKEHGCDHVINYRQESVTQRVKEITGGEGVPVVYDSVGKDTWEGSLDCLRPFGLMVSFGNSSGPVSPVSLGILGAKGSLYVTRPSIMTYTAKREDLTGGAQALFDIVLSGAVKITINQTYPLAEAAQAHRDLEARKTTGSTILLPSA
jgi:NADPH2:quinone reductase